MACSRLLKYFTPNPKPIQRQHLCPRQPIQPAASIIGSTPFRLVPSRRNYGRPKANKTTAPLRPSVSQYNRRLPILVRRPFDSYHRVATMEDSGYTKITHPASRIMKVRDMVSTLNLSQPLSTVLQQHLRLSPSPSVSIIA